MPTPVGRPRKVVPHVALIRNVHTNLIEPATRNGVVIIGSPVELRAAFGRRVFDVAPASQYVRDHRAMPVAEWLAGAA